MSNTSRGPRKPNKNSPTLRQRRKDSKLHVPSPAMTALVIHGCNGFGRRGLLMGEAVTCSHCHYVECAKTCKGHPWRRAND